MKLSATLQQPAGEGEACTLIDAVKCSEVEQEMLTQFLKSYFDKQAWNQWKEFHDWIEFSDWYDG